MNNILKIFVGTLRRLKIALILAVICGAAGIAIYFPGRSANFSIDSGEKIDVAVIDNEQTEITECMKKYFSEKVSFNIIEENPEKFNDMLLNTDVSAIIEIPKGLQQDLLDGKEVKIKSTTLDDYENGAFISVYIDSFMQSAYTAAKAANHDVKMFTDIISADSETRLSIENAVVSSNEPELVMAGYRLSAGFMLLLIFGVGIFVTLAVMDDKSYGTYNRMRVSSVTGIQYITGTALAALLVSLLVSLPLVLFLIFTGAPISLDCVQLIAVNVLFSLFSSGLSILLALLIRTKQTLFILSGCIASVGTILGGAFFPVDDSIGFLKCLSVITPHYWFMNFVEGSSQQPMLNILILALFAVIMYLASAVIFSKRSN